MRIKQTMLATCAGAMLAGVSIGVLADPLSLYGGPVITDAMKGDARACLTIGDAVSCSAGMLNVLAGRSATDKNALVDYPGITPAGGGFVIGTPQGALKNSIVVYTGGNAATDNGDTNPTVGEVQDAYKSNSGKDKYVSTGKNSTTAGNLVAGDINALNPIQDKAGTWDVDSSWLSQALTVGGKRRELMIGFDYNQPQSGGDGSSLSYWALVTLHKSGQANDADQINFEIRNTVFGADKPPVGPGPEDIKTVSEFTTDKTFDSKPVASDFGIVNVVTCYQTVAGVVTNVIPSPSGVCPAGYQSVDNAKSDSTTEIITFLPELNTNLESYISQGYDTISVRMLFGCFDNNSTDSTIGQGYLADGSKTTGCDLGGNVDVYLLAGAEVPNQTPEPGSLALVGVSLFGLVAAARRRRAAAK